MISYITTAIPYVNARPHLGHALELVQADVLARHRRLRGHQVGFLTGTDDHAAKNVTAAAAAGQSVADFVDANGAAFLRLADALAVSNDDAIHTSSDRRHRPAVIKLWEAIRPDLYQQDYTGLYCPSCEQFYAPEELAGGLCPEHRSAPQQVTEQNWFFALSRYQQRIEQLITDDEVLVQPAHRKAEVLSFIRSGLNDFSVSRPAARSDGWGIAVPGDPGQIVYVWADALINYLSAAGYGIDQQRYRRRWCAADERVHVIGKGISRFHAVYWLGLLLSAGEPLPTRIAIHEYLQVGGRKIAKSDRTPAVSPEALLDDDGRDAVRWWLASDVSTVGDTDFTVERLRARYNEDLANTVGNLVNRTVTLAHRGLDGTIEPISRRETADPDLLRALGSARELPGRIDEALEAFDHRRAAAAIVTVAAAANAAIEATRPWQDVRAAAAGDAGAARRLRTTLSGLITICATVAVELGPFVPDGASRLLHTLGLERGTDRAAWDAGVIRLGPAAPAFPRLPSESRDRP